MKIITWNINSVRLRLGLIEKLTKKEKPDILCLQETKVIDDLFPVEALEKMGYKHQHFAGMKSYNGVAILSKVPLTNKRVKNWCGKEDCRHIYATLPSGIELHNVYIPAGGDIPDPDENEKFAHKLEFLDEMTAWWSKRRGHEDQILVGDLNIAPLENDVWSHRQLIDVVSHTPIEVKKLETFRRTKRWVDAIRFFVDEDKKLYSWWSYRARDWKESNRGRRLDHIWVTPSLKTKLKSQKIIKVARGWQPKPSDHVPVILEMKK